MAFGPIQLIIVKFDAAVPIARTSRTLINAAESGAVRLIDLHFIRRDSSGRLTSVDFSGLDPDEQREFGTIADRILGLEASPDLESFEANMEEVLDAAAGSFGLGHDDIQQMVQALEPGGAVALILIEHHWAKAFRDTALNAGGSLLAQGFLTPETTFLLGAEIEAQNEALQAIAAQEEAAEEARKAIEASEVIAMAAARRAAKALVNERVLEQAALDRATQVVVAAMAAEEAALTEADEVIEDALEREAIAVAIAEAAEEEAKRALETAVIVRRAAAEEAVRLLAALSAISGALVHETVEGLVTAGVVESDSAEEVIESASRATDKERLERLGIPDTPGEYAKFHHDLTFVEGIGPVYSGKLREAGLTTPLDLLERCATRKDRASLAEETGISHKLILTWVNQLDLYRIKGIGTQYADMLEAAGVDTVIELAQRNPENLHARIIEANQEKNLVREVPSQSQVTNWIEQAKELPRIITY
jgi:predicted flap endonuclease-1-like 5' DNA nuclease